MPNAHTVIINQSINKYKNTHTTNKNTFLSLEHLNCSITFPCITFKAIATQF